MEPAVLVERNDGIAVVRLNRPQRRNAFTDVAMIDEVADTIRALDRDREVRCLVLTGNGSAFSAGGDLKAMLDRTSLVDRERPEATRMAYRRGIQQLPELFEALEVPVIAAVNGPAMGAGCDLAMMCDIRIASETARFAESFVKVGIVPGDGGAYLLPKVVGMSKALEMSLTGDAINPAEALACGLVSKVVAPDQLLPAAREMAARIAVNPPQAVRLTKRLLRESQHMRLSTLLEMSAAYQALAHGTRDHREAVDSMLEKRAPHFEGR